MASNARELAFKILVDINKERAYSNIEINKLLVDKIDSRDQGLIREIVYGVLENRLYIDHVIAQVSKIRLNRIHFNILEILRIGIYQIMFMDKIPDRAAVDESVKLATKYGHKGTVGYVNGVLRNIVRRKETFEQINVKDQIEYISIKYSHPLYLVKRWVHEFGLQFTIDLCKANNQRPALNIRVNTLKTSRDRLKKKLEDKGFLCVVGNYANDCLIIENPQTITETEEYKEGLFFIQDESSMLVAQIMDPDEGSTILDLCAAPGGKSTHLAQKMNNKGQILSRDIHQHKIKLINNNAKRLGIEIIRASIFDALKRDKELLKKVDYCLLDAPCSGFGIIRRKPEIKWNRKEKDIKELSKLQEKMLDVAKDYIKVGGSLIYSTCTIEKEENMEVINKFLKNNPHFSLANISDKIENKENLETLDKGYIQLYPNIHGTDGFFIAKMIRER